MQALCARMNRFVWEWKVGNSVLLEEKSAIGCSIEEDGACTRLGIIYPDSEAGVWLADEIGFELSDPREFVRRFAFDEEQDVARITRSFW